MRQCIGPAEFCLFQSVLIAGNRSTRLRFSHVIKNEERFSSSSSQNPAPAVQTGHTSAAAGDFQTSSVGSKLCSAVGREGRRKESICLSRTPGNQWCRASGRVLSTCRRCLCAPCSNRGNTPDDHHAAQTARLLADRNRNKSREFPVMEPLGSRILLLPLARSSLPCGKVCSAWESKNRVLKRMTDQRQ